MSIIQQYSGQATPQPFVWSHASWQMMTTGFPANPTFTKQQAGSYLDVRLSCDFNPGSAPDVLCASLWVDGSMWQNNGAHVADSFSFLSIAFSNVWGDVPAGDHTVQVRVSSASNGPVTLMCAGACNLQIIECI